MIYEPAFDNVSAGGQTWRLADDGDGPVVVLVHGFPDFPHSWAGISHELVRAGNRVVVPYLRGYHPVTIVPGRSYDAELQGVDLIGLLDVLGIGEAVLVGHDWGASGVYAAAAAAPTRVQGIVPIAIPHPRAISPSLGLLWRARHFISFKLPFAEARTRRRGFAYLDRLYDRWGGSWSGPARSDALARAKTEFADPVVLRGALDYYRALSLARDGGSAPPIRCPGLLVAGGDDFGGDLGPYERSRAFWDAPLDILVIDGAGHWPHREGEARFVRELVAFVAGVN